MNFSFLLLDFRYLLQIGLLIICFSSKGQIVDNKSNVINDSIFMTENISMYRNLDTYLEKYTKNVLKEHFQLLLDSCNQNGKKYNFSPIDFLKRDGIESFYQVRSDLPLIYVNNVLLDPFTVSSTYSEKFFSDPHMQNRTYTCVYIKPKKKLKEGDSEFDLNLKNGLILFFTNKVYRSRSFYLSRYKL